MDTLTIIIIVVLAGSALSGLKAGLIKTVFSMFSVIAALLLTIWINPLVSDAMQKNEKIMDYFEDKVANVLSLENLTVESGNQESFIDKLNLPDSIKNLLLKNNNTENYKLLNVNNFASYITTAIAKIVINAVSFLAVFLVIFIVLRILCFVLDIISKLPVLNSVNKLGGLTAGLIRGLIIVWVIFIIITAAGGTSWGQNALATVNDNKVLSFLYDYNLVSRFVTKLKF